jgi:hypothetical protein
MVGNHEIIPSERDDFMTALRDVEHLAVSRENIEFACEEAGISEWAEEIWCRAQE